MKTTLKTTIQRGVSGKPLKRASSTSLQNRRRGQTMMEYIVLVALLGVASIPIVKILGSTFRDRVNMAAHAIAGESAPSEAKDVLKQKGNTRRSMSDFYHQ